MNVAIHPRTSVVDATFTAWRMGRHIVTVDGVVYMAPGRDRDQILKAFKLRALVTFASDLAK